MNNGGRSVTQDRHDLTEEEVEFWAERHLESDKMPEDDAMAKLIEMHKADPAGTAVMQQLSFEARQSLELRQITGSVNKSNELLGSLAGRLEAIDGRLQTMEYGLAATVVLVAAILALSKWWPKGLKLSWKKETAGG